MYAIVLIPAHPPCASFFMDKRLNCSHQQLHACSFQHSEMANPTLYPLEFFTFQCMPQELSQYSFLSTSFDNGESQGHSMMQVICECQGYLRLSLSSGHVLCSISLSLCTPLPICTLFSAISMCCTATVSSRWCIPCQRRSKWTPARGRTTHSVPPQTLRKPLRSHPDLETCCLLHNNTQNFTGSGSAIKAAPRNHTFWQRVAIHRRQPGAAVCHSR
jgi:hypothetical protein